MIQILLLGFLIGFMLGIILVTGYYIVHYHSKKIKQYSFSDNSVRKTIKADETFLKRNKPEYASSEFK